jgi:sterol desaturase/sphingolipid hydroxylase (fatty acid hydroxylase superfamily)
MSIQPETARLLLFVGALAFFYLVESLIHVRPWHNPRSRRLLFHAFLAALNTVLMKLAVAGPLLYWTLVVERQGWGLVRWFGLTGLSEILVTLVVLDCADYWWHLWNHRVPFLWRFHQAHHVDTHVDVTTSLRFHPGELLLSSVFKALWLLVWGPSMLAFTVFEAAVSLASRYHHSNFDYPDRLETVLRWFNVTPRMHTSHHSAITPTLNANFSTIFSIWDRLFGTYVTPTPEHLQIQGLRYGRDRDLDIGYWFTMPFQRVPTEDELAPLAAPTGGDENDG